MKKKWTLGVVVAVCVGALSIAWWGYGRKQQTAQTPVEPPPVKAELTKVRIGYQPTAFYSYLFVAEDEGMFKAAGLEPEMTRIPSANKMFQAYLAGQLDMTGLTATEIMLRGYEKDPGTFTCPLMVEVNGHDIFDKIYVLNDSPVKAVKDLAGKKIGSHPGTTVPNIIKALLRKHGVDPDKAEIQTLKPNLQVDSLLSGAVDALVCFEPSGAMLMASGKCRVLYEHPFDAVEEDFPGSFTVLSKEFQRAHPEAAAGLSDVIRKSVTRYRELAKTNKAALDRILVEKFGLAPEIAERIPVVTYRLPTEWDAAAFANVATFYVNIDVLSKPLTPDAIR